MFAGLFLLIIGAVMVGGAIRGVRHGRVMTLVISVERSDARFARRGERGFWLYTAGWLACGAVILYQAVRLLNAA